MTTAATAVTRRAAATYVGVLPDALGGLVFRVFCEQYLGRVLRTVLETEPSGSKSAGK